MIDKATAARQLERLTGLDFFPREAPAKKELLLAIQDAVNEAVAAQVISDWLRESSACPKPAELRRAVNAAQESLLEQRRECQTCGGQGAVTVWRLVTYRGNSFTVHKTEALPDVNDNEAAQKFSRMLAERYAEHTGLNRQTVLSAAKSCACRG
mgnify:CR=1 FL=1